MSFVNPYNFVPLTGRAVKKPYKEYIGCDKSKLLTGKFSCSMITKTPLIIPDHENGTPSSDEKNLPGDYPFMKVGGSPMIPGSSLRGVFRNAFEIITDSCMFVNDDYYFSSQAETLKKEPGLLEKTEDGWVLYKARRFGEGCTKREEELPTQMTHFCNKRNRKNEYTCRFRESCYANGRGKYVDILGNYSTGDSVYIKVDGGRILDISKSEKENHQKGYVLKMNSLIKASGQAVFVQDVKVADFPDNHKSIKAFLGKGGNLEKFCDSSGAAKEHAQKYRSRVKGLSIRDMIPVWFAKDKGNYYFSLSQMSRSVYTKKPQDFLKPLNLTNCKDVTESENVCPACALFGLIKGEDSKGSRVRFSDAFCNGKADKVLSSNKAHLLLSSPRSSSLEFYLRGPDSLYYADQDGVELSGRKFYWHHNSFDLNELPTIDAQRFNMSSKFQYANVHKNDSPVEFRFDVYFDGIAETELNQLYTALTFNDNKTDGDLCHKIGHGKPLGFGSVKVTVQEVSKREYDKDSGGYIEDRGYLDNIEGNVKPVSGNIRKAVSFSSIKGHKIHYPRLDSRDKKGDIFAWFSENRKFSRTYRQTLPMLGEENQSLPYNPKDTRAPAVHQKPKGATIGDSIKHKQSLSSGAAIKRTNYDRKQLKLALSNFSYNPKSRKLLDDFLASYEADPKLYHDYKANYESIKAKYKK